MLYVGDDWAMDHHDIHVMDPTGAKLAARRLPEGPAGMARFHELVGRFTTDPAQVLIGIETDHGLWVDTLVACGYRVVVVNPATAAGHRRLHQLSGAKSDPGDARMLADLVRTNTGQQRELVGNSDQLEQLQVLARTQQQLIWSRTREVQRLREQLRHYHPGMLVAFSDLTDPCTLAVLGAAPDPDRAKRLSVARIDKLLRAAGRKRGVAATAAKIHADLNQPQLAAPAPLVAAYAATTSALVAVITALNTQIQTLETELGNCFEQHPDADIYLSLPGLGRTLGARVLSEFGDDPNRYADAKSRRNYAGTSPITITSGRKRVVISRKARNKYLAAAIHRWAFCALTASPGARACYDRHRAAGATNDQALLALGNQLVAILHGCLKHHQPYQEAIAWQHQQATAA